MEQCLSYSNFGVAPVCQGEERAEPNAKPLILLVFVGTNSHLWPWDLDQVGRDLLPKVAWLSLKDDHGKLTVHRATASEHQNKSTVVVQVTH